MLFLPDMAITILAIGKTKRGFIQDGIHEYMKRIKKYSVVKIIELPDSSIKNKNEKTVIEQEADIILEKIKSNDYLVLLDSNGKQFSSLEFAGFLQNNSRLNLCFCIGGVYGVSRRVKQRADYIVSFSKMTFTHQMIRLLLTEQIYRALNINHGGNYHK